MPRLGARWRPAMTAALACCAGIALLAAPAQVARSEGLRDVPAVGASTHAPTATPTAMPRLKFAVKGDWGNGGPEQAALTARMCEWRASTGFAIVVTTGDNFYHPDGMATDENYYLPEACLFKDPRHRWRASWGNHDVMGATSTNDVLGAPLQPRYYSWQAGTTAFFVYDGNAVTEEQKQWLRESVCASPARVKIIYGHQPPFATNAPYGSDLEVQAMVHPVAKACGVRLVLSGHQHHYERNGPIDGVTYIVSGGGGGRLHPCGTAESWSVVCESTHHFLSVEVSETAITVSAVNAEGRVFDSVAVPLQGSVAAPSPTPAPTATPAATAARTPSPSPTPTSTRAPAPASTPTATPAQTPTATRAPAPTAAPSPRPAQGMPGTPSPAAGDAGRGSTGPEAPEASTHQTPTAPSVPTLTPTTPRPPPDAPRQSPTAGTNPTRPTPTPTLVAVPTAAAPIATPRSGLGCSARPGDGSADAGLLLLLGAGPGIAALRRGRR